MAGKAKQTPADGALIMYDSLVKFPDIEHDIPYQLVKPVEELTEGSVDSLQSLVRVFDETCLHFEQGDSIYQIMTHLTDNLCYLHAQSKAKDSWIASAKNLFATHPLMRIIHECPFTRRAYEKPRGYAGDAELIDYIYGHKDISYHLSATAFRGKQMAVYNCDRSAAAGVRTRRNIIASRITEIARSIEGGAQILSIAGGHGREIELLEDETSNSLKRFVVLDQDRLSLTTASHYELRVPSLRPYQASIGDLLKGLELDGFDFIYASGLYDYLNGPLASKLTQNLFNRLNPGGRLLIGNFLSGLRDFAFIEICMGWTLIYRTRTEIKAFASKIDKCKVGRETYFTEPHNNIGFIEITKR